jgi:hypothetical protein
MTSKPKASAPGASFAASALAAFLTAASSDPVIKYTEELVFLADMRSLESMKAGS